ncbi:flagellar hook-associated protein FlgK [Roseospirillum parvum]|uniref:Flagellar hook-associated protein 1 n=1 Tax=Roseospirillum parvum TaxID=83401 RepID=A0A1G8ANY3_9PROT|nr:flagellar hook-associated protein FlgK [Roseospirillum parvum]SDH22637.1 flagellar hook-associated protein 1 FlgK [Roseospirillum parvum]
MSINDIINSSTSGLLAVQTRIAVTSTNISNADTEGYTAKSVDTAAAIVGGQAVGVSVVGIGAQVDRYLYREVIEATSEAAHDAVMAGFLESAVSLLGDSSDGADLADTLSELMTRLDEAAASDQASTRTAVLNALESFADTLSATSGEVQGLRTTADARIAETVDDINALLNEIDGLNAQITGLRAHGQATADLEDSRRTALAELAELVDINHFTSDTGEVQIYSAGGSPLLTGTVHALGYEAAGRLSADNLYDPAGGGSISGITSGGEDITDELPGGQLGALIELRDSVLPGLQDELDDLAVGVMDSLNAAANAATAVPPPASLTSDHGIDGTAAFSGTGTVTLLATDADGNITDSTTIDLSTITTHADLVSALDGAAGVSASLDADGTLTLSADDTDGGVILTGDGTVDADGRGLSHHLGLNNLLSGSDATDITLNGNLETQGLPQAVIASTTVGDAAYMAGDTSGLKAAWSALDDTILFDAAGELPAGRASALARVADLVDGLADRAARAADSAENSAELASSLGAAFGNAHGVNVDEETARLVALEQSYAATSQVIATVQDMFDSLTAMMN